MHFPINYQIVFIAMSVGGLITYYYSSRIQLDDIQTHRERTRMGFRAQFKEYWELVSREQPFKAFVVKRFVFLTGQAMLILPLYLVRVVKLRTAA